MPLEEKTMTPRYASRLVFVAFVILFAVLMMVVLFTAVSVTSADVIQPSVDRRVISVGAAGGGYRADTGVITITDNNGAFTYSPTGGPPFHPILDLSGDFGGSYLLRALFDSTGSNAPLDGLFKTVGDDTSDLVITGEIPSLSITRANRYTGTLLEANVVAGELFGYSTSNMTAQFNLLFEVIGGDMVAAGVYPLGATIGELSSLYSLTPSLPGGFDFQSNFTTTLQSGSIGVPIPEPATVMLLGLGLLGSLGLGRLRRRQTA
jgi:hypothetical protein